MSPPRRDTAYDSESSYSDSDVDVSDYDDFVVPVHKKGQPRRGGATPLQQRPKAHFTAGTTHPSHKNVKSSSTTPGGTTNRGATQHPGLCSLKPSAASKPGQSIASTPKTTAYGSFKTPTGSEDSDPRFPVLNLVVCGRVDVGKSTLLGHLLKLLGAVDSRSFRDADLSWILDQGEDERSRGITIDPTKASAVIDVPVPPATAASATYTATSGTAGTDAAILNDACTAKNVTGENAHPGASFRVKLNFIDTPGHHDLVSSLVRGAVFATAAVVIVDVLDFLKQDPNGFFEQHFFLLWSLGVRHFIICVNKLDRCDSRDPFDQAERLVRERVSPYASSVTLFVIPTSGLRGLNLVHRDPAWGDGFSLVDALRAIARYNTLGRASTGITAAEGQSETGTSVASPGGTNGTAPDWQLPEGAVLCHIFDMWEVSKTQVGCACFSETVVRAPCKLVSLPSGNPVTCSEFSCLTPDVDGNPNTRPSLKRDDGPDDLSSLIGSMSLSKSTWAAKHDFVDSMILRGQEIQALVGDRLLVDLGTLERVKAGTGPLVEASQLICYVSVCPTSRHKLTIGFGLEVFVGYFQTSASVALLWEHVSRGKWKRVTSLWPGREGVLVLNLGGPLFVQPVPLGVASCAAPQEPPCDPSAGISTPTGRRLSLLSRALLKTGGDVVAGGAIVDHTPQ
ncbi:translation elongation factor 1-alpha [Babesia caballi]|uniref:Translation elongation factor 1-alpha n=1 Tax=Babesia caballi TaxID=5871 RepID=A0AAV4LNE2_BABCB|nr:translation elongation factor 1-alpha [Babesia caballi]